MNKSYERCWQQGTATFACSLQGQVHTNHTHTCFRAGRVFPLTSNYECILCFIKLSVHRKLTTDRSSHKNMFFTLPFYSILNVLHAPPKKSLD